MIDSEKSIGGFFTTHFWLILILGVIIVFLYLFGIIDIFFASLSVCNLGEGLECKEYHIFSNETYGLSNGDDGDGINITLKNNLPYEIRNVVLSYGFCRAGFQDKKQIILSPGQYSIITMRRCENLPSDSYTKSSALMMYDVIINSSSYPVIQYGTVSGVVDSSTGNKPYQKIWYAITEWFRLNIG